MSKERELTLGNIHQNIRFACDSQVGQCYKKCNQPVCQSASSMPVESLRKRWGYPITAAISPERWQNLFFSSQHGAVFMVIVPAATPTISCATRASIFARRFGSFLIFRDNGQCRRHVRFTLLLFTRSATQELGYRQGLLGWRAWSFASLQHRLRRG